MSRYMDDLISRQAAIDALDRIFDRCEEIEAHFPDGDPDKTGYKMFPDYMTIWKYLRQLPSAERRGRWTTERTMEHDGEMYCDQCGWTWENLTFDRTKVKKSPYCPNCGAKMEE